METTEVITTKAKTTDAPNKKNGKTDRGSKYEPDKGSEGGFQKGSENESDKVN